MGSALWFSDLFCQIIMVSRESDIQAYYDAVSIEREDYITSLWWGESDLHKRKTGKQIYDTFRYPGKKLLRFHRYDMHRLLKNAPEKYIDKLDNHPVVQVLQYFVDNAEDRMHLLRSSDQWGWLHSQSDDQDLLEHENQVYRELSTSHKKEYFEKLLATIQTRKTQYYESSHATKAVVFNENMYVALANIATLSDDEKNTILDSLLLQLPNQSRDYMPDSKNIEQLLLVT